jgi:hypothetical protein
VEAPATIAQQAIGLLAAIPVLLLSLLQPVISSKLEKHIQVCVEWTGLQPDIQLLSFPVILIGQAIGALWYLWLLFTGVIYVAWVRKSPTRIYRFNALLILLIVGGFCSSIFQCERQSNAVNDFLRAHQSERERRDAEREAGKIP